MGRFPALVVVATCGALGVLAGAARADTPSLAISPPADITVAATGPCGQTYCAQVSYSFTVSGGTPPYRLVCNLDSGSQFTVGSHTISCLAQDSAGNSTPQASFTLTVTGGGPPPPPPPPPASLAISPPADITVAATGPCGQTYCAQVSYSFTVSGGTPPYRLVCNLDSGSQFTVGSHTISCLAQDSAGNSTPQASFTLTVTGAATGGGGAGSGGGTGSGGASGGTAGGSSTGGGGTGGGGTGSSSPSSSGGSAESGAGTTPTTLVISAPSTVTVSSSRGVYVTVTTRHTATSQTLCWQPKPAGAYTCAVGHGAWRIRLAAGSGKHALLLQQGGRVVARKAIVVKVKA